MYEQKQVPSPVIHCIWHAVADRDDAYSDPANEYWSLGFSKPARGSLSAELYGPSLRPRTLDSHKGDEYWGVEFNAHVLMRGIPKHEVLEACIRLEVDGAHFAIANRRYPIPVYEELEAFVADLQKDGTIISNQQIYRSLRGDDSGFSERSRQRHTKNVTGLTHKQIEQLRRARHAFYLLQHDHSLAEAALEAGYADQSHMTRALKLLHGQTPAKIIASHLTP